MMALLLVCGAKAWMRVARLRSCMLQPSAIVTDFISLLMLIYRIYDANWYCESYCSVFQAMIVFVICFYLQVKCCVVAESRLLAFLLASFVRQSVILHSFIVNTTAQEVHKNTCEMTCYMHMLVRRLMGIISSWWWLAEVGSEVLLMRWNLFAVASPSTIRNQKLSVQRPCCIISFDILPSRRPMRSMSGVLERWEQALSIGRTCSFIGRLSGNHSG